MTQLSIYKERNIIPGILLLAGAVILGFLMILSTLNPGEEVIGDLSETQTNASEPQPEVSYP